MKKRAISLLLATSMVAATFAGCSSSTTEDTTTAASNESATATTDKELSGEITFVAWGSDNEIKCDEEACQKFMELYPNTTVNFEALNDDYSTTVETRYLGGETPDVIYGHPQTLLKWIQEGMLEPITDVYEEHHDELFDEELYSTNLYDSYKYNDEYYATPVGADTTVLFYNKTMLDEAGIAYPTKDTTWEEFAEMCKKLTKRDDEGIPSQLGIGSITDQWMNILYSKGGKFLDDMNNPTKVVFDSDAGLETLQWINDNYQKEGGFTASDNDNTYLTGGFGAGEYAFYFSGVYDIVWLSDVEGLEWDIAPIPGTMSEEGDTPVLYAGYSVSSKSENKELAKEFAYFMTTYDAQKIMAKTGLITPLRKDVAYSDEVLKYEGAPENHSLRVDNLPYAQNSQGQCLCWWEMTSSVDNNIYKMVNGEQTPEEAMKNIQAECEKLLDEELNN